MYLLVPARRGSRIQAGVSKTGHGHRDRQLIVIIDSMINFLLIAIINSMINYLSIAIINSYH